MRSLPTGLLRAEIASRSLLPALMWAFSVLPICSSCSDSFYALCAFCSCRFGVSVGGGEPGILLHRHIEPQPVTLRLVSPACLRVYKGVVPKCRKPFNFLIKLGEEKIWIHIFILGIRSRMYIGCISAVKIPVLPLAVD